MKFVIAVGDGMADEYIEKLGNKTPLEFADTPNLDLVAQKGICGMVNLIPDGFPPASDIGNMSIMGYDPQKYHTGRAPIEAASLGIKLEQGETAFRCNLVTIKNEIMDDYSAGHITTESAEKIISQLKKLNCEKYRFYLGTQYRHILVVKNIILKEPPLTPPHDISGQIVRNFEPRNEILKQIRKKAHEIIENCDENKKRIEAGQKPVTDIWLWGEGKAARYPSLKERYGITGAVISAVDLVKGIGVLGGMEIVNVEGATGYLGTNYAGKIAACREMLKKHDFVYIHLEAPDETAHEGDLDKKIQAIEEYDKFIVGEIIKMRKEFNHLSVMVLPDHPTFVRTRTHAQGKVPFAVFGEKIPIGSSTSYCERSGNESRIVIKSGEELFDKFIRGGFVFG
ncbi:MAG: cofactor-independent phosphoglycerate mutase [Chitinispirillales bacterium]|jgi:2,3-bisphosphoglycerate-independent phosphoglycerate mutase|nr:cofactor-independent phosphoglycerate mutase [Chitinispirillales bacterium]